MIDGKIGIRTAADLIDTQAQFQRLIFQALRFDQQPGHGASAFQSTAILPFREEKVENKISGAVQPPAALPQRVPGKDKFLDDFSAD
jgi:hypothetical protein